MRLRRTFRSDRDIRSIGERQLALYADQIEEAIGVVGADPMNISSRPRPEIGERVRSFRLESAAMGRRASHVLYYVTRNDPLAGPEIVLLRVLHERMNPGDRVASAVRETLTRSSRPRPPRSPGR